MSILTFQAKQTARQWIDDHFTELSTWHQHIWNLAEPAWREWSSPWKWCNRLRGGGGLSRSGLQGRHHLRAQDGRGCRVRIQT